MKNNEQAPQIHSEMETGREKWGKEIAKEFEEFGVKYIGEFFEIPHYDEQGKELKRTRVHAWEKIPLWSDDGKRVVQNVDIKQVIKAKLKYPNMGLHESLELMKQKNNSQDNA
jgi:hypothetical protein